MLIQKANQYYFGGAVRECSCICKGKNEMKNQSQEIQNNINVSEQGKSERKHTSNNYLVIPTRQAAILFMFSIKLKTQKSLGNNNDTSHGK